MNSSLGSTWLTFGLLALAICAVWFRPVRISARFSAPPWIILFGASIISGLAGAYLTGTAVAEIAVFGVAAYLAKHAAASRWQRIIFGVLSAMLALALAMHRLPGFNNPRLIADIKFSADAAPFTLYANFDKAAVGLILLAWLCNRTDTVSGWRELIWRALPIAVVTAVVVIVVALTLGYVRPEIKLSWFTPVFLVTNLLFTCVAEEAFFRGFLQDRLVKVFPSTELGALIAVLCSGALFGAAHFAGGPIYVLLATLGGLGYACAYAAAKRIEAPIMAHFAFNAVHFIGFTYPHIQ